VSVCTIQEIDVFQNSESIVGLIHSIDERFNPVQQGEFKTIGIHSVIVSVCTIQEIDVFQNSESIVAMYSPFV